VLTLLLGCAPSEPPAAPAAEVAAPVAPSPEVPALWTLSGRVTPGASPTPVAPEWPGGAAAIQRCEARRPCAAELWTAGPDARRELLRVGRWIETGGERWPARWTALRGTLSTCLVDPLFLPPGGDPEGRRLLLHEDGRWRWAITLAGARCGLSGTLLLDAGGSAVDASGLSCAGLAWKAGGRECAQDWLRAERRALARAHWAEMDAEQRELALIELSRDPEAAALAEALRALP